VGRTLGGEAQRGGGEGRKSVSVTAQLCSWVGIKNLTEGKNWGKGMLRSGRGCSYWGTTNQVPRGSKGDNLFYALRDNKRLLRIGGKIEGKGDQ